MFPYVPDVSWEAHLFGFLAGIYFSVHYLRDGPPNDPVPEWMEEEDADEVKPIVIDIHSKNGNGETSQESTAENAEEGQIKIQYTYLPKEKHADPGDEKDD
jgi:hypothetical protein